MEIIKGNLYRSKDLGVIVMAEERVGENTFSGQVVVDGDYSKGHFSNMWAISGFQPYSAEIILKEVIDFSKVQFLEMNDGEIMLTNGKHNDNRFFAISSKSGFEKCYAKSDVKRVVTPNFT
jgi:hypothetical protein